MFSRVTFVVIKNFFCLVVLFMVPMFCFSSGADQVVPDSRVATDDVKKCGNEACKCSPVCNCKEPCMCGLQGSKKCDNATCVCSPDCKCKGPNTCDVKSVVPLITVEQLERDIDSGKDVILVNVLDADYYSDCHIKGSVNIYHKSNLEQAVKEWSKDKYIVTYCASCKCSASMQAAQKLRSLGFSNQDNRHQES